jgi:hypothetical protein
MKPRKKARYGERQICACCEQDIEFHGAKTGWIDRGANRFCSLRRDYVAGWAKVTRKKLHKPCFGLA